MGYRVFARMPGDSKSGYLCNGRCAPAWNSGTYYNHPSSAKKAAQKFVERTGGTAEIRIWKCGSLVEMVP